MSIGNTKSAQTDFRLPLVKTDISRAKMSYSGASLFNSLPSDLKTIENYTVSSFTEFFLQLNHCSLLQHTETLTGVHAASFSGSSDTNYDSLT